MKAPSHDPGDVSLATAALALTGSAPSGACPAPEDVAAWHEDRLPAAQARRVQEHVAACERCFALWHGLLELDRSAPAPAASSPRPTAPAGVWGWRLGFGGLAAALVAAVLIGGQDPALPPYELSVQGQLQVRGEPDEAGEAVRLVDGNRFELLLRPATGVEEALAARVWVVADGVAEPLEAPPPRLLARGVVVLEGEIGRDVRVPEGSAELLVVVGRPDDLPEAPAALRAAGDERKAVRRNWSAWRVAVVSGS